MTATYVCRHCGEPAVGDHEYGYAFHDNRGDPMGAPPGLSWGELDEHISTFTLCNPADPNSPTCEAVEAGSDIGILWAAHHDGWVARVRVHGGEIVALDVPTILADFGGDWLEDFADMADTRRPLL